MILHLFVDLMQNNSEVAFQQIFELAPAAFILVNNEGKIEFINRQSEKLFSYKKTELSGQSVYFLISENFSENYHKFESYLRTPHTIEGAVCLDLMALRKDGTVFPVEIALNSLDNMVIIVVHDITDKKIAESNQALFTSIINSSDDAIISKTLDGIITSWNRGAERLFGYTMKEAVGRHVSILIPPSHISDEHEIIEKIRKGEYIQHYETQRIRKDGSLVHISLTVSPILDQNAKIIGASKIARNISEKKIT